jgi:predicted nucleotidyltransferase component of viral defense system
MKDLSLLSQSTKQAWDILAATWEPQKIYLAGGTALLLHLGHRVSEDLDFFTNDKDINVEDFCEKLDANPDLFIEYEHKKSNSMVAYLTKDHAKISLFQLPNDLLVDKVKVIEPFNIASIIDIGVMKLIAIVQRGRLRDFIDLWAIEMQTELKVENLLLYVDKKYPYLKNVPGKKVEILKGLAYFEDARVEDMPRLLNCEISKDELEKYWQKRVVSLNRFLQQIETTL